jgi:hypothetical protein
MPEGCRLALLLEQVLGQGLGQVQEWLQAQE